MSELKAINAYQLTTNTEDSDVYIHNDEFGCGGDLVECYLKSETDKVIAEKDAEIRRLKNRIAPKQSDKTLQERLNEVCEKHGVSTLQDLDWAFCESEKRYTKDRIEVAKRIYHHKYKRCLALKEICLMELDYAFRDPCIERSVVKCVLWRKWANRWHSLAQFFKEAK